MVTSLSSEDNGKLYPIKYDNEIGIKKVFKDKDEFYFEPHLSNPQLEMVNKNDPKLHIAGRIIFSTRVTVF